MSLTSVYSTQTSRQERLNYFAYAIEKEQGRSLAFQSLDKKDRITFLALCKFKGSMVSWKKIGNETLQSAVQHLLHGPKLPNLLQLPPQEMTKAHLSPFLTLKDLANLQSTHKAAPELSNASLIIKNYGLAPLIARYCHQDCETLSEGGKIKALYQLMSMVQELRELEQLEVPSYQSIGRFFELVEARSLLRMAARMNQARPFTGIENEQLQIAEDSAGTLQRAATVRAWFREHPADLQAFVRLDLNGCNLTLLPTEIGQLGALTELWLDNNRLTSLPKEIGQLGALTELWLRDNRLTRLPKEIGQLGALTELWLRDNRLTSLPKEIGQLGALTELWLRDNRLTSLPKEIGQLGALTLLRLDFNRLSSLPKEIGQLGALQGLALTDNRLTSLPKEIGQLRALKVLWVENNRLTRLPKEIGQLRALNVLWVENNRLTRLPKEIGQLVALTHLLLSHNLLTSLPKEIGQLGSLTYLQLENNRLTSLPKEIRLLAVLRTLYLNNNHLTSLLKEIGQLGALTHLYLHNNRLISLPKEIGQLGALTDLVLSNNRLRSLPKEIGQLGALTDLELSNNRLRSLPKEIGELKGLNDLKAKGNGLLYLPAKLKRFSKQLKGQNQTLQMKTILNQLRGCLKGKHDCRAILARLDTMEKLHGKEMRSQLHGCIYEVCKNEKSLKQKLKSAQFGRKAFVDPAIDPKFKIAALKRFEDLLKGAQGK